MSKTDFFSLEITDNTIKIFDGEILPKEIVTKKISLLDNLPFSFFAQDTPDNSQKFAEIIKKLVSDLKIGKRKVNVIIPDAYTYSQILPCLL
jgi:Tfp pilus assembly PilM family ATPase